MTFEQMLGQRFYQSQITERAYTDKLLARRDISQIQELMKKDDLTRSELLNLLYLLSSSEIKLANFGDWDRYLLGKFLAWIRDFVSIAEILYDYKDKYDKAQQKDEGEETDKKDQYMYNPETMRLLENNRNYMLHNIKFLVDIFLYLSRSTLSLSMSAFEILSTSRYEYSYPGMEGLYPKEEPGKSPFRIHMRS